MNHGIRRRKSVSQRHRKHIQQNNTRNSPNPEKEMVIQGQEAFRISNKQAKKNLSKAYYS
jgi:hypothetical protein